jgi:hypothetical protein
LRAAETASPQRETPSPTATGMRQGLRQGGEAVQTLEMQPVTTMSQLSHHFREIPRERGSGQGQYSNPPLNSNVCERVETVRRINGGEVIRVSWPLAQP